MRRTVVTGMAAGALITFWIALIPIVGGSGSSWALLVVLSIAWFGIFLAIPALSGFRSDSLSAAPLTGLAMGIGAAIPVLVLLALGSEAGSDPIGGLVMLVVASIVLHIAGVAVRRLADRAGRRVAT